MASIQSQAWPLTRGIFSAGAFLPEYWSITLSGSRWQLEAPCDPWTIIPLSPNRMAPVPGTFSSAGKSFGLGIVVLPSCQTSLTGPRFFDGAEVADHSRAGNSKVILVPGG